MQAAMARKLRVLLVEDHEVVRTGLRLILQRQPDMEVVGEAGRGDEALEQAQELRPDVVVLDLGLPGLNGAEVAEALSRTQPQVRIVVLTVFDDEASLHRLLQSGASGYVLKSGSAAQLCQAIRAVAEGRHYIDPRLSDHLVARYLGHRPAPSAPELSPREREVLRLAALGYTHREIAERVGLSVKTVDAYCSRICAKLGLQNRVQLVRYALLQGLLREDRL